MHKRRWGPLLVTWRGSMSNSWRGSETQSVVKTESSQSSVAQHGFGRLFSFLSSILLSVYQFLYSYNTDITHALSKNLFDFDFQALSQNLPVNCHHVCQSSSKVSHVTGWSLTGKSYDFAREQPLVFSSRRVLIAKCSINNVWESPECLLPALLVLQIIISESPVSWDKSIGANFVVIALTIRELWVLRDAPTQCEQSIATTQPLAALSQGSAY